jgi:hypothetical protein
MEDVFSNSWNMSYFINGFPTFRLKTYVARAESFLSLRQNTNGAKIYLSSGIRKTIIPYRVPPKNCEEPTIELGFISIHYSVPRE